MDSLFQTKLNMFAVAFYKGTSSGLMGLYDILARWWTRSSFSHCEMIFSDGVSASSSFIDGGVRFKRIDYNPDHWEIIELPTEFEAEARAWFSKHEGQPYDLIGNLGFVLGPVKDSKGNWFCSEAVLASLGVEEPFKFSPSTAMPVIKSIAKTWSILSSST